MPDWSSDLRFTKDPDAVLDYKFDFAAKTNGNGSIDWLQSGETIVSKTVTVSESGLTKDSDSLTDSDTSVTVWLSGGANDTEYTVACRITTSSGRTDERTITIYVYNQ